MYLEEVQKHLESFEMEVMLMNSKQLKQLLNLSWPTIEKVFLVDPNFPSIRIGNKWAFNRREVQKYIDRWSKNTREKEE
ncbi:hypothetical protein HM131_19080 [Halobacillus mangrovi]|uniref:DNA-binding protein n=2 Tax=Halobacillus mangrovi TaxID=402384 RepID=A0A1W6A199_9BACI|nr:hypothetical protein HM131_19080 [Halobacillus mangrovi]